MADKAAAPVANVATAAAVTTAGYSQHPNAQQFIAHMVKTHGFSEEQLIQLFTEARYQPTVARLIAPPTVAGSAPRKHWQTYRARVVEPIRIQRGTEFWNRYETLLQQASNTYGVPPEIIVGIIGVETIYGRNTGSFRVLDTLSTLAFDYPPHATRNRSAFFLSELEQFLLLSRESKLNPLEIRGSFAGAIGLPQFMPGSWRRFAVDFDQDGKIDLQNSIADVIGSVAHFLQQHGWINGLPTHYGLQFSEQTNLASLLTAGIEPQFTREQLTQYGVWGEARIHPETQLALIDLPNQEADGSHTVEYVLGTRNFYAITRYNRSNFYAMSVIDLGQAIRKNRELTK